MTLLSEEVESSSDSKGAMVPMEVQNLRGFR